MQQQRRLKRLVGDRTGRRTRTAENALPLPGLASTRVSGYRLIASLCLAIVISLYRKSQRQALRHPVTRPSSNQLSRGESMEAHRYRPDIDGLRTIAIVPVVLFHAGIPGLGGGFAGVDVFFVISGFLITGILYKELSTKNSIDILSFYARRIARIFPALILVCVAMLLLGGLLLSSALFEVQSLTKSVIASLGFVANFYFLSVTSDYFATDAQTFPFLHMWSLAVEEQYYLIWPIVMIMSAKNERLFYNLRARLLLAIILITVISLCLCGYLTPIHPAQAFYLPFPRAWELGCGSVLALFRPGDGFGSGARKALAHLAAPCGLALVVAGFVVIREGPGFPFPLSLLTIVGTMLMIWGGDAAPEGAVSRLLGIKPLVSIGRVSYAWYLWHWPLLSFAHILALGEASPMLRYGLVIASLILSYATMHAVEIRIRLGVSRRFRPIVIILGGLAASALTVGLAGGIYLGSRMGLLGDDPRIAAAVKDVPARHDACLVGTGANRTALSPACLVDGDRPRIVLWGDSHASQWAPALETWARANGNWAIEQVTMESCPPLPNTIPTDIQGGPFQPFALCKSFNDMVWSHLQQTASRKRIVVLSANWRFRAAIPFLDKKGGGRRIESFDMNARDTNASLHVMESRLDELLSALERAHTPVITVLQSPVLNLPPAACVERLGAGSCAISETTFASEAAVVNRVLRRVAGRHQHVAVLNPQDILCKDGTCPAELEGRIAYRDQGHIAASAARSHRSMSYWTPLLDKAAAR
jgi:peptidoglycan/LPS O-acetylase OafA/YrhL